MNIKYQMIVVLAALALAGAAFNAGAQASPPASEGTAPSARGRKALHLVVNKSPHCSCCEKWVEHMEAAGFDAEVRNVTDMHAIKQRLGVPAAEYSCHTAQVGGYFIEGHVPAEDVKRLLAERPEARGLVVPGMPKGSPGMEVPDGSIDAYTVELVANDGSTSAFAQHGQ